MILAIQHLKVCLVYFYMSPLVSTHNGNRSVPNGQSGAGPRGAAVQEG